MNIMYYEFIVLKIHVHEINPCNIKDINFHIFRYILYDILHVDSILICLKF